MVRAPCCEKMGLKRGPWTPDEDQVLVTYIQRYGHGNWRALPKQAGLLRCGKSCRLRWTNYLRPDIKRGNFSREEEDTIIKLHQMLGNRWSAIAARLPGRTDNEIKNVWHTHLKKRLKGNQTNSDTRRRRHSIELPKCEAKLEQEFKPEPKPKPNPIKSSNPAYDPVSPQQSYSDVSNEKESISTGEQFSSGTESVSTSEQINMEIKEERIDSWDTLPQTDENLWSQFMPMENFNALDEFSTEKMDTQLHIPLTSFSSNYCSNMDDNMDFWHDIFQKVGELSELPEF